MKTNQLKAGDCVQLSSGWEAEILDNKKGNIRLARVDGLFSEIGSIYSHDISFLLFKDEEGATAKVAIQHTAQQKKLKEYIDAQLRSGY